MGISVPIPKNALPEIGGFTPNPSQYKRYLLSLNGSKLAKHLRKEKQKPDNGKLAISTDLSYWMHDDQEKFSEMLRTMMR